MQGLLQIIVNVVGPDESTPVHLEHEEHDTNVGVSDMTEQVVLVPPSVQNTGCVLRVNVHRAEDLPQMDYTIGTLTGQTRGIDAYVAVRFAGSPKIKTKIVKHREPSFNMALYCPIVLPCFSDTIEILVMDRDVADGDDHVGTLRFSFADMQVLRSLQLCSEIQA